MSIQEKANSDRVQRLMEFSQGIMAGQDGKELIDRYQQAIENITPYDMVAMEDKQLQAGVKPELIKEHIEKIINVLKPHLENYDWEHPGPGHPLYYYMEENRRLEELLAETKQVIKKIKFAELGEEARREEVKNLQAHINQLRGFNCHYVRKENILFPYLEQVWDDYRPLQVMWSLHDDIRRYWKELDRHLEEAGDIEADIGYKLGKLFLLMYRMIFKEEQVVFPIAAETVAAESWQEMLEQGQEEGYFKIDGPEASAPEPETAQAPPGSRSISSSLSQVILEFRTGKLTSGELELIFNHLPVDITYVDENDRVRFYSDPPERVFPRSPAIVGRAVQNCHPPESVDIVEKILSAFKAGKKNKARFWIKMHGLFIVIEYFALRDKAGKYRGTLEVSQDITELRELEGEQRLLDWSL